MGAGCRRKAAHALGGGNFNQPWNTSADGPYCYTLTGAIDDHIYMKVGSNKERKKNINAEHPYATGVKPLLHAAHFKSIFLKIVFEQLATFNILGYSGIVVIMRFQMSEENPYAARLQGRRV